MQRLVKLMNDVCTKKTMTQLLFMTFFCVTVHLLILQYIYNISNNFSSIISLARMKDNLDQHFKKDFKYILAWNKHYLINAETILSFSKSNCSVKNCVFTENRNLLYDQMRFEAIVFDECSLNSNDRPLRRLSTQVYIFSSKKSSYIAPACELYNEDFFNLTFTYRLDSDVVWNHFTVRNISGAVVAPNIHVRWKTSTDPVHDDIKSILGQKQKLAAWIVNDCEPESPRNKYLTELQEHLFHYALKIDIYGKCSNIKCPNNDCGTMIRYNYHFYIAFENSFAEDYVTEKVLYGYNNYAVPIVYGGANYSRFLPPGSYINAREIHPYNLAYTMHKALKEPALYESYFRWMNHYTIQTSLGSYHHLCNLCAIMHSPKVKNMGSKKNFRVWWNSFDGMKLCLPEEYWKEALRTKYFSSLY